MKTTTALKISALWTDFRAEPSMAASPDRVDVPGPAPGAGRCPSGVGQLSVPWDGVALAKLGTLLAADALPASPAPILRSAIRLSAAG